MTTVISLLNHYRYIVLTICLMLEYVAFPVPGETIMTYCGFLVFKGKLNYILSIIAALSGTGFGITISYFVGATLGYEFFEKYGDKIHIGPKKLEKISAWFDKHGNKLLIFSYFIPGVRHLMGYFSGITKISYRKFAVNAYCGALLWVITFITLGKFLGHNYYKLHGYIGKRTLIFGICIGLIFIAIVIIKHYSVHIKKFLKSLTE